MRLITTTILHIRDNFKPHNVNYQRNTRKQSKDHAYARVRRAAYDFLNDQNPKKNIRDGLEDGEDDGTDEIDALLLSKIVSSRSMQNNPLAPRKPPDSCCCTGRRYGSSTGQEPRSTPRRTYDLFEYTRYTRIMFVLVLVVEDGRYPKKVLCYAESSEL